MATYQRYIKILKEGEEEGDHSLMTTAKPIHPGLLPRIQIQPGIQPEVEDSILLEEGTKKW